MHRRALMCLAFFALAPAPVAARAQSAPAELRWTRIPAAELERYEATVGGVRLNNLSLGPEAGSDPAGPATAQEFNLSIANRAAERRRVIVQLVGVRADGTPTFSTVTEADVDPRRNETVRERFFAAEEEMRQTQAYFLRVLAVPLD